ncbi:MAG: GLUG motif-containing protein, partial [Planctomycetota bacterium]
STVTGDNSVGGLVGNNNNILAHCYASGSVLGTTNVGGLVGENNYGTITHCYATASVTGTADVGGLVGAGNHRLALGEITFSFWDIQTSGQASSGGVMGKTTAEMQNPNTFMNAGWDFVDKPDGPSDIWAEPAGGGYPILWWQLSPLPELPTFSGGTGEPEDPYLVSTAADLNSIGHNPRLMGAHFKLIDDIDLTGIDFFIIGNLSSPFTGVFDGNGHTISNFSYTSTDTNYAGLFGYVEGAEFKDLGLIAPDVDASGGEYVGSLVASNGGTIINCYVEGGSVSGRNYVGGLVGRNNYGTITNCYAQGGSVMGSGSGVGGLVGKNSLWGTITDCYAAGSVLGDGRVGGLVGALNSGTIINCYANGSVTGYLEVGGMAGYNSDTIINCYASGSVSGEFVIGGLAGCNRYGEIINCCASGSVTGNENVGGMVGSIGYFPSSGLSLSSPPPPAKISNCYSTGDVTGNRIVGGLVGWLIYNSTITNCYSTGSVSGNVLIGGLAGAKGSILIVPNFSGITGDTISDFYSTADITVNGDFFPGLVEAKVMSSFWDTETSGQVRSMGGIGKTTAEMQTASTFLDAGWDFMGETKNGTEDIWWILEARPGRDYPRLWWEAAGEN